MHHTEAETACAMERAAERTPRPKSPPEYAGLYGNRRHLTNLMLLEKEITSLQEELKSLDVIQPSSRCCQEVNEFVVSRPDPLLATDQKHHKSNCCLTRCWGKSCLRPKGNYCRCWCCFNEDKKNPNPSIIRSKKPSSQQKPRCDSHRQHRVGYCCGLCQLDSFNGNRKCCSLPSVSCPQPSCCCTCCGASSSCSCCSSLKLCSIWCIRRSKCCPTCTQLTNCKCCCFCC